MSNALRTKGRNQVVWGLMALLMLGLGGFGVTNFSGGIRHIGSVGKTDIAVTDYARDLRAAKVAAEQQLKRGLTGADMATMGLNDQVLGQLFSRAAYEEAARRAGVSAGDAEVARQITSAQAFSNLTGTFDRETYRMVLRQQGITEAAFESKIRRETAASLVQGAVVGGVKAPAIAAETLAGWALETRDFTEAELIASDLPEPVAAPDEAALKAYYEANPERYTAPETRELSYLILTPEMMLPEAQPSEEDLRAAYEAKRADYSQPERRLVERLVFPSTEEAATAKARFDAGDASFEQLAQERGLALADIDLGEVSRAQLGAAGEAVFALTAPGVVGPLDSELGPALYAMNAILDAQETSFEEAKAELAGELSLDRARRLIGDKMTELEDELAGGASLEDMAKAGPMKLETVSYVQGSQEGIAAYQAFREAADAVTEQDFPTLLELDDGGLFALRLDKIVPPTLKPFDTVREQVVADWTAGETHARLVALAAEKLAALENGGTLASLGLVTARHAKAARGAFLEGLPPQVVEQAFELEEGKHAVVETPDQVRLVTLEAIHRPDPASPDWQQTIAGATGQLSQQIAGDLDTLFAAQLQREAGVTRDQAAINAVQAQAN